jgi:hypothetical protein
MWNKKPLTEKLVTSGKPVQTAENGKRVLKSIDVKSRKSDQKYIFFSYFFNHTVAITSCRYSAVHFLDILLFFLFISLSFRVMGVKHAPFLVQGNGTKIET